MNWLDWKLKHGLATRGRPAPMQPQGLIARTLYKVYYHKHDVKPEPKGGRVFKVNVGGNVNPSGKVL